MSQKNSAAAARADTLMQHQQQATRYADILRQHADVTVAVTAVVIGTVDGILISSISATSKHRPAQLAAMASSLLAVAMAAGREVGHKRADRMIIESGTGTLIVKPVGRNNDLVLCMALPPTTVLGKALWAADEIARELQAS